MVTLVIEGSGGSELTYELSKSTIAVGAASENDVVIRMPGVASRHLVIQKNRGVYTFLAQPRQMVVLNGERRARGVLRVGDKIRVGTVSLVFKGVGEDRVEARGESGPGEVPVGAAPARSGDPVAAERPRSEVVLYSEAQRLSEARSHMVEIFRANVRSNVIPSLRAFFEHFFDGRQAMLATLDEEGCLQPLVSQWSGEIPRLPARTYDELGSQGRFAVLHLRSRQMLIYPVGNDAFSWRSYLVVETSGDDRDEDELLLAELARVLAIHWERVEQSSSLLGPWEAKARKTVEDFLPGTSHGVKLLRDGVVLAARGPGPVLLCGRGGTGRMAVASLLASLNPSGPLSVQVFQGRSDEDAVLRAELLGLRDDVAGSLVERARGGVLVVRDAERLSQAMQRELAAAIQCDLDSGYGPGIRWMATTAEDAMGLLNEGVFDSTLFKLFNQHLIRIPPLGERREDLPLVIVRLLGTVAAEQGKEILGIELETLNSLVQHPFDGQMTELLGELRRLVSAASNGEIVRGIVPARVLAGGVPPSIAESDGSGGEASFLSRDDLKVVVPAVERMIIDRVLRRTLGNQSKAARVLNLSRGALIAKMKEYEIPDYRYLRRNH